MYQMHSVCLDVSGDELYSLAPGLAKPADDDVEPWSHATAQVHQTVWS